MSSKIIILTLLGLANVYCQAPCSHGVHSEPNQPEASNVVSKYEPVPAAQEILNREYLPPLDFAQPQANQAQPVYVAPPQPKPSLPKLQPLPQVTAFKPVYQAAPSTVQPQIAPLPKLQPLPQATYVKPTYQPLPKLQPLANAPRPQYVAQPLPKLQPIPSSPRPVISQTLPPSTLRPLPILAPQPAPTLYRSPPLKPVQPFSPKQIVPIKSFQPKDNDVQASNNVRVNALPKPIIPRIVKPDFETAAQTNRLNYVNPDNIRINHYICEQGDPQQKFLCDILKLWDIQHPKEIVSNDLDNPGDNSNNNPAYVSLPTSPRPRPTFAPTRPPTYYAPAPLPSSPKPVVIYTPSPTTRPTTYYAPAPLPSSPKPVVIYTPSSTTTTTTTTSAPEPEENLPGDSEQNVNAIYLPPYSTTPEAVSSTTVSPTTVEIPKRVVAPSNDNIQVVTPDDTPTPVDSTTPSSTTPVPTTTTLAPKEGYEYPKPSIPFPVPEKEGYDYPKPSIPFPVPEREASIPFSNGTSFSSYSSAPLSSFNYPAPIYGSSFSLDSRISDSVNQFPFGFAPLASFSDVRYQPLVPSPVVSTTVAPDLFFKSNSELLSSPPVFSFNYQPIQSVGSISSFNAPPVTYSDQTISTISPYTLSTPAPPSLTYTSQPAFSQSLSTLAPLLLSKESLALTSTAQTPSALFTTTESPIEKISSVSTEKPIVTSTYSTPLPASFNSPSFGQYHNQLSPVSYSFPSFDQSLSSIAPLSYNFDNSLNSFNSFNYQPLSGQSFSNISPLSGQTYSTTSSSESSTEKSSVTTTAATPTVSSIGSQPFSQYFNSPPSSFSYNFQPIQQSVTAGSPLTYNFDQSFGLRSNYSSLNYQPLSEQSFSAQPPVSYNFQPLGESFLSGQSYSFPSSFGPGVQSYSSPSSFSSEFTQSQFTSPDSPAVSYTASSPSPLPLNFQSPSQFQGFGSTFQSPSQFQGFGSTFQSPSQGSLFGQSSTSTAAPQQNSQSLSDSSGSQSSSSFGKSGLSFGSQVQSVENLKDLQATAKELNIDLDLNRGSENSLFSASNSQSKIQDAPTKSVQGKEDISLGNIEILKVKRKSSQKH